MNGRNYCGRGAFSQLAAARSGSTFSRATRKQFDTIDRANAVVFVTCSPLEVHGPQLPLGADCLAGEGLAERMLCFLPERHRTRTFLKLPFIYAACDGVPQPGTIAFRSATTIRVIEELGHSLAAQGFQNVVVSNFHGSPRHFVAIETACDRISRTHGVRRVSIFSPMLSRLDGGGSELGDVLGHIAGVSKADLEGDTHGGFVETSQLLALHPNRVGPDYKRLPRRTVDLRLHETGRAKPPREAWHSPFWKLRHIFVNPLAVRFFNWLMRVPKTVG